MKDLELFKAAYKTVAEILRVKKGEDLLMGAPSEVTAKQLRELHIRVVGPG